MSNKGRAVKRKASKPGTSVATPGPKMPLATDFSDRRLWRTVQHAIKENQRDTAALLKALNQSLDQQIAAEDRDRDEHREADIRNSDQRRDADIRDGDERRSAEIRTLDTRTNREEDRKDTRLAQELRERETKRTNASRRDNLLMTLTALSFIGTTILVIVSLVSGHLAMYGASGIGALFSAAGFYRLLVPGHSREPENPSECLGRSDRGD